MRRDVIFSAALIAILASSLFFTVYTFYLQNPQPAPAAAPEFYVGVQCGYDNVSLCKALIDKTKNSTNLFILGATGIVKNTTELNEVCDYAYDAGMHFSVYFSPSQTYTELGENTTFTYTLPNGTEVFGGYGQSPIPTGWLKNATAKYGSLFLGAYFYDEPGGNQLDKSTLRLVESEKDYSCAADAYVQNLTAKIEPYLNTNVPTFTADYGLYWFDYQAGYDFVLADFGFNNSRQLQTALCRGAANVQGKDWGIMVTHRFSDVQLLGTGQELYDDLVSGYNAGAKYAVVFDFAETSSYPKETYQPYEYGILHDEHFKALEDFWSYLQNNPEKNGSAKADLALVLPRGFGLVFRDSGDKVWGLFDGDQWSQKLWSDVEGYVNEYGSRLDILYDDPAFNEAIKNSYGEVIYWTSGDAADTYLVKNLNTTFGYNSIQEAIDSGATADGQVLSVKAGVYPENLVIDKSLTILGENKATTIIDGSNHGTVVNITTNNVTFSGFTVKNSGSDQSAGIYFEEVSNCTLTDNTVENSFYGIYVNGSSGNTLQNNVLNGNAYNLGVDGTEPAHFVNYINDSNTADGKKIYYLINEDNLYVNPSSCPDVGYLALVNCTDVTVEDLSLSGNANGILLVNTQNSTLTNNDVSSCVEGIRLINSEGNSLRGNQLSGNTYNFWVQNGLANDVDETNTVNGKLVYYWVNQHDKTVPTDAGFVALINCSDITVQNLDLSENWQNIVLSSTTNSTLTQNQISSSHIGIALEASSQNSIIQNSITGCAQGIAFSGSGENSVLENELASNQLGAYVTNSNFNAFTENKLTANTEYGLQFTSSNNNTLTENQIGTNQVGVEFMNSSGNTIAKNSFTGNIRSIQVYGSCDHTDIVENEIADSTSAIEIAIYKPALYGNSGSLSEIVYSSSADFEASHPVSSSHSITANNLTNNEKGIVINDVNASSIADNTITEGEYGIILGAQPNMLVGYMPSTQTIDNSIRENTIRNTTSAIYAQYAYNCSITENQVVDCENGISMSSSTGNQIIGNVFSCTSGIYIGSSAYDNLLRQNQITAEANGFSDNSIDYRIEATQVFFDPETGQATPIQSEPHYYTNDVDTSNTVNGKPICYWVGQNDKTVPTDVACVILVNCTNVTAENLNLTNNSDAIVLAYSNNCTVRNNNLQNSARIKSDNMIVTQNSGRGIRLLSSSYNLIEGNNIANNAEGITLAQTVLSNFNYTTNEITYNACPCTGNSIVGNNLTSNSCGVNIGNDSYLSSSTNTASSNTFCHNNFVNNTIQVNPSSQNNREAVLFENNWDNGAVGNYWSDYNGTDSNGDGIGDSVYQIRGRTYTQTGIEYVVMAEDHFPLMHPFT